MRARSGYKQAHRPAIGLDPQLPLVSNQVRDRRLVVRVCGVGVIPLVAPPPSGRIPHQPRQSRWARHIRPDLQARPRDLKAIFDPRLVAEGLVAGRTSGAADDRPEAPPTEPRPARIAGRRSAAWSAGGGDAAPHPGALGGRPAGGLVGAAPPLGAGAGPRGPLPGAPRRRLPPRQGHRRRLRALARRGTPPAGGPWTSPTPSRPDPARRRQTGRGAEGDRLSALLAGTRSQAGLHLVSVMRCPRVLRDRQD